jgi:tetratricopeptide (TPR) repeat protein
MSIRVWGSVSGLPVVSRFLFILVAVLASAGVRGAAQDAPAGASPSTIVAPVGFTIAHRPVSTSNADAQDAFDDGLTLLYAFDPEQARVSFRRAIELDPQLAIAWWGVAMSYGTNINTAYDPAAQRSGRDAIAKARALEAAHASASERALIDAADVRFSFVRPDEADRSAHRYRDAMYRAAAAFQADDDVQTLAAEAEMDAHPWDYFTPDGTPTDGTPAIVSRLQTVLARDPAHLGAEHYLIHALEESQHPEGALPAAERLAAAHFEPAAEHLTHMPAHTFMRVGMYHEAGMANVRAVAACDAYVAGTPAGHANYRGHDCAFGIDAFMMAGEYARARALAATCDGGHGFALIDLRFARYDALAKDVNGTSLSDGMLALHDGRAAAAARALAQLRTEHDDVAVLSADMLAAAIAERRGDETAAIAALAHATGVQNREGYSEPPEFAFPMGEKLGAAYYRAGRFGDAERAFRDTLERNRDDPRALFGLARTLEREGRTADAAAVDARFATAWRQADTQLDMKDL